MSSCISMSVLSFRLYCRSRGGTNTFIADMRLLNALLRLGFALPTAPPLPPQRGSSKLTGVGALATDRASRIRWASCLVTGLGSQRSSRTDHGSDLGTPVNFDDPSMVLRIA